ncbi:MAG: fliS [Myxococcaceae bacterium]|nr:fliS [Myxococcaceae bacterium]
MSYAVSQYRSSQVHTASPARVIVQFYDGALKFIRLGAQALEVKDFAAKGVHLSRAHAIVSELRLNLDSARAPELTAQLDQLYLYILSCITAANMQADAKLLAPATNVLMQLRSAWVQVAEEGAGSGVRAVAAP